MNRWGHLFVLAGSMLLGVGAGAAAGERHPFTVHDLVVMDRISDLQVSPDGGRLAFVLRTTDLEANRGRLDLWLIGSDGSGLRRLTSNPESDYSPRWAPDGRSIWFLSTRSGSAQVWRLPVDGGEAVQVTDLPLDVENLVISPTGRHIAFTLRVFPELETVAETVKKLEELEDSAATGRIYDRLFVRHWDTWKDGRRSHLFVMDLERGSVRDVMKGHDADTPSQPFGGPEEIAFSPDGRTVVYTVRDAGREEAWSTNFDLFAAAVEEEKPWLNMTGEKNPAWDTTPVFSPNGKYMAFLAMSRPGYEADRYRIVLRPWPYGPERAVADDWDRSPHTIFWSRDGGTLYAVAENRGQGALFAIDLMAGKVRALISEGHVRSPALAGDRIVFAMDSLRSPVTICSCLPDGSGLTTLFDPNAERLSAIAMGDHEQFTFKGWNDEEVHGYVVKPVEYDPDEKYPVAFLIHGGPQGSFGNDFHYRWNPQTYAGAGYAVVMVDFHGSVGYGQGFTDSIRGDWGGKPLEDLQKGLAAALKRYPWMDGDRVSALGASFGGYMINWIAGKWPDRFRCLVCHDGNLDERMAYFDTEELWFPEWDHEGTPWIHPNGYEKHNPVNLVQHWKTPMLIIHGARDFRVVDTQGLAAFTACQRLGIPSRLLYYPDENHWVLKPHNSIQWHDTVLAWLDQWTAGD